MDEWGSPQGLLEQSSPARSRPYLPDHGAPVVDELRQHHGHVVVDGGRVVRALCRVAHEGAQGKDSSTANLGTPRALPVPSAAIHPRGIYPQVAKAQHKIGFLQI